MVRMGYRAWCARMNRKTRSGSPCSPARTRLPPLPGCRAPDAGDGSHVEGAPVPPAQRLSARQRACQHPARLASPKWKSTGRSARTRAPTLRAYGQIAPDRPSVAGTPADKRFGSAASDTSKINFKGVHQTGSTPHCSPVVGVLLVVQMPDTGYQGTMFSLLRPLNRFSLCLEAAENAVGVVLDDIALDGHSFRPSLRSPFHITFAILRAHCLRDGILVKPWADRKGAPLRSHRARKDEAKPPLAKAARDGLSAGQGTNPRSVLVSTRLEDAECPGLVEKGRLCRPALQPPGGVSCFWTASLSQAGANHARVAGVQLFGKSNAPAAQAAGE